MRQRMQLKCNAPCRKRIISSQFLRTAPTTNATMHHLLQPQGIPQKEIGCRISGRVIISYTGEPSGHHHQPPINWNWLRISSQFNILHFLHRLREEDDDFHHIAREQFTRFIKLVIPPLINFFYCAY